MGSRPVTFFLDSPISAFGCVCHCDAIRTARDKSFFLSPPPDLTLSSPSSLTCSDASGGATVFLNLYPRNRFQSIFRSETASAFLRRRAVPLVPAVHLRRPEGIPGPDDFPEESSDFGLLRVAERFALALRHHWQDRLRPIRLRANQDLRGALQ